MSSRPQTFVEACMTTVRHCPDPYAKSYANAGIGLTTKEEIQCQCLYILNNMSHWRGPIAKQCRETFKRIRDEK